MTVSLLKDSVEKKLKYIGHADKLELFLAKDGGVWLLANCTGITSLENGVVSERMNHLLTNPIDLAEEIDDVFGSASTDMKIHVLVNRQCSKAQKRRSRSNSEQHREELTKESLLTEWEPGSVHHVPLIYNFMKDLGGCSTNGKIFWRREDQQLVSLLVKLWFQENISVTLNAFQGRQSIVVGAQGVGKSTVLCVLAFYLVMTRKKNVLVYRRLTRGNCLFYLGYDDAKHDVRYFMVKNCGDKEAIQIYKQLIAQLKLENVWLLLDGFEYDKIPDGMRSFELLSTSLHVDLKSQDTEAAFTCLLSSWTKADIFKLGQEHVRAQDASKLLSNNWSGSDRMQQTFIRDDKLAERENEEEWAGFLGLLSCKYWDQAVDAEYAFLELTRKLPAASTSKFSQSKQARV